MNIQERQLGAVSPMQLDVLQLDASATGLPEQSAASPLDAVRTQCRPASGCAGQNDLAPAWMLQNPAVASTASGSQGGIGGIISQLLSMISQLLSMLGLGGTAADTGLNSDQYFNNATASSTGDPHLSFDGTLPSGATQQNAFTSQAPQPDLLNSESFPGGYRVSTALTQPDANGNAYNSSATVSTENGATRVSLDNRGDATVFENGRTMQLAHNQSLNLGNGETVRRGNDGTVTIADRNAQGGAISTILRENGRGVDVSVQARNVELGGSALGNGSAGGDTTIPRLRTY